MCARLPIGAVWGHPRLGEVLLCWMHVPSLVLCYEIRSIPFSILTFSRVRGHLAKKPLLVMGEGQGEWVFFFFSLCYQNWTSWLLLLGWGAGNSAWSSCGGGGD